MKLRDLRTFMKRYARNRLAMFGLAVLLSICLIVFSAPFIAPFDPAAISRKVLSPPSGEHLMGTDHLGRDVFSRFLYGAKVSLLVGFGAALGASLLGLSIGSVSGYYGGRVDDFLMRVTDLFLILPTLFLALLVLALFGSSLLNIIIIISIMGWPSSARIIRAQFLSFKTYSFVEAARLIGASDRVLILEILPNAISPAIINTSLYTSQAILMETSLSFVGLGDPSHISWGKMLFYAQNHFRGAWWVAIFPGLAIFFTVLALNLIADGLNDALNPRSVG